MKTRILFVLMFLMFVGCAQQCGESAYRNEVFDHVRGHEFDASAEVLWKEAQGLLKETGYQFPSNAIPTDESAVSDWVGEPGARTRYSVRIISAGETRQLQITKIDETKVAVYAEGAYENSTPDTRPEPIDHKLETERTRDLDVEWDVVQRLDPEEAVIIKKAAKEREEKVKEVVANGCQ